MTRREMIRLTSLLGAVGLKSDNMFMKFMKGLQESGRKGGKMISAVSMVDHLVFGFPDLDDGIAWVEKRTGVRARFGGVHPGGGTRNALLSLGESRYLEIIAPDPAQDGIIGRFGDLRSLKEPKLITWAAVTKEIRKIVDRASALGYETGPLRDGSRARPDGKLLKWQSTDIKNQFDGLIPFFIEWGADSIHPSQDSPKGCKLSSIEMEHPEPEKVQALLEKLGIELNIRRGAQAAILAELDTPKGRISLK
ncbi:MAG: VOC family protein [Acidobacteria bacterium]|nr:VOC family protein [Acidobacteriota bacterium]